ncbi:betaine-aldehyde dehydrogenase [Rhodococcus sp. PvP016]|uniref:Betaine-aldehyde dehydrogenase n=2 Tax=Mycobacteriales TaxID=85007 RepID=A0ABS2KZP0_9NOCA|nr:betaine-aldehyde dehydrogenase [Rhodococcus corynebacterioides]MBP1115658.1 betaine-aldehyde dehydrogenase [Rhodococcus sp. PvP016]
MMTEFHNVIGGREVGSASGRTYDVYDPCTGDVYAQAPLSDEVDIDRAYAAAAAAQNAWARTTPQDRSTALLRIADAMDAHAAELTDLEVRDTGKPYAQTLAEEIPASSDVFRFFAGAARILEGRSAGEYMAGHTSWIRREPIGVVGQVAAWNYPLMMMAWKIAPALAAGNTVVLKPGDTTPASSTVFGRLCQDILPAGVLNVVCGGRDTGRALVAHRTPELVAITGSVRAGIDVATSAASDLKRVHLELGGNAPVLVFDDADIAAAAAAVSAGGFVNAGQDCTAATRVLVSTRIHADFVAALVEASAGVRTGSSHDNGVTFGPLNSENQLRHVTGLLDRVPSHARVELGGSRQGDSGYFVEPTIVSGLRQNDEQVQTEIFGPVITVQAFDTEAEAMTWSNEVDYGLAASVWTSNHGRALRASRDLDFGTVWINTHLTTVTEMPHGGFKHSGYGKDLSMYGFEDYTRIKHVMSNIDV